MPKKKISILVVDDEPTFRKYFSKIFSNDPELEFVGSAENSKEALIKIKKHHPQIVLLDMVMPKDDGIYTLKRIMKEVPTKVIMMTDEQSSHQFAVLLAIELGAVDFFKKPITAMDFKQYETLIKIKIKNASIVNLKTIREQQEKLRKKKEQFNYNKELGKPADLLSIEKIKNTTNLINRNKIHTQKLSVKRNIAENIIAIGTSTGGPNVLKDIFINPNINLSASYVIVQHMPVEFTPIFAERLNTLSKVVFKEAEEGDVLYEGTGFLARGNSHLQIINKYGQPMIHLSNDEKVSGHRPSIDVMFYSLAKNFPKRTIAIILTGMGRDGVDGIGEIKRNGGFTIAQDKETSVVFGMNKEAIDTGCIDKVLTVQDIVNHINFYLSLHKRKH